MLFNSYPYLFFLPIVFLIYWLFRNSLRYQNLWLLLSSAVFYGLWDWRFLFLLTFSIILNYITAIKIQDNRQNAKLWLLIIVIINCSFLGILKYYNFFIESLSSALLITNSSIKFNTLNIILPVGISFYTFHGLSYIIDVYYKRIKPTHNLVNYSLFVSFFPLLVAGPIERATHLLPQIERNRKFNYNQIVDGLKQILWGFVKKVVVADTCATWANQIFNHSGEYNGSTLVIGAILFTFQIYGDFSGYSDIALGSARLFGIQLLKNFNYPYFSRSIAEFWRRWHISLSSWFKDYLYIPLGGSKKGLNRTMINVFIIFVVSGLWHGANWTFILWGFLNALFIIPSILFKTNRSNLEIIAKDKILPSFKEGQLLLLTFGQVVLLWIIFRSDNITMAYHYIREIFSPSIFSYPQVFPKTPFVLIIIFLAIEWLGRINDYAIKNLLLKNSVYFRWAFYYILLLLVVSYSGKDNVFIYFQF